MALNKKVRVWIDIALIAFVMLFPHFGHLPMYAFPFVVLGVIWIYLNLNGESFAAIGFRFSDLKMRAFLVGGTIGLLYAAFSYWILGPFITHLGFKSANLSDFNFIRHHFLNYIFLVLLAAFLVIPFEEIAFRGFSFTRIKAMVSNSFFTSGIITSVLFAAYH